MSEPENRLFKVRYEYSYTDWESAEVEYECATAEEAKKIFKEDRDNGMLEGEEEHEIVGKITDRQIPIYVDPNQLALGDLL